MSSLVAGHLNISQNQFVQASHRIMTWLEQSKANTEQLVDELPDIFAIINEKGYILKGNGKLASIFQCEIAELLNRDFSKIFRSTSWKIFNEHLLQLQPSHPNVLEFELSVDGTEGVELFIVWTVRLFHGGGGLEGRHFAVFGRDVSAIKAWEKRLTQIFSTLPLGIIQVDEDLQVTAPYSAYTEYLLNKKDLVGKSLEEELFQPAWERMTLLQREGVNNLKNVLGFPPFQFDFVKHTFPRLIFYPLPAQQGKNEGQARENGRWFGINYEPIVYDETVEGMLVIIEDRTEVELLAREHEVQRRQEDELTRRFLDIRRLDDMTRSTIMLDLHMFFSQLESKLTKGELVGVLRALHGIKGTARVANISRLKELAHIVEDRFLNSTDTAMTTNLQERRHEFDELKTEWKEVKAIATALGTNVEQLALSTVLEEHSELDPREMIEPKLRLALSQTSLMLGKKTQITMDWGQLRFSRSLLADLSECLLHIINNAVDHGIEAPAVRAAAGKNETGLVTLQCNAGPEDYITLTVEDDGRGLSTADISRAVLIKGLMSEEELVKLSEKEIYNLIFLPGFSTAERVSTVSGRGIGLDAVISAIKKWQGNVKVINLGPPAGARFIIRFKKSVKRS